MIKINISNEDGLVKAQDMKVGDTGILVEGSKEYTGNLFLMTRDNLVDLNNPDITWDFISFEWKVKLIDIEIRELKKKEFAE